MTFIQFFRLTNVYQAIYSFYESYKINTKRNLSFLSAFFRFDNVCLKNILTHFPAVVNAMNYFRFVFIFITYVEKIFMLFSVLFKLKRYCILLMFINVLLMPFIEFMFDIQIMLLLIRIYVDIDKKKK